MSSIYSLAYHYFLPILATALTSPEVKSLLALISPVASFIYALVMPEDRVAWDGSFFERTLDVSLAFTDSWKALKDPTCSVNKEEYDLEALCTMISPYRPFALRDQPVGIIDLQSINANLITAVLVALSLGCLYGIYATISTNFATECERGYRREALLRVKESFVNLVSVMAFGCKCELCKPVVALNRNARRRQAKKAKDSDLTPSPITAQSTTGRDSAEVELVVVEAPSSPCRWVAGRRRKLGVARPVSK
ncbi:hypothetical protein DXG01_009139 [Tephrocybe rancida]|nr:hypothetical protein DXG01_009139 [Tephrocybe rancida]